ncbi:MAG: N-acetyltransferase [Sporomusaceae bacterium]|nr:N-acetyltransferase [Sporomusaceae bacterium]
MEETLDIPKGNILTRIASICDIRQITEIYNEGILDRIATLESNPKTVEEMERWFSSRSERHKVIVAEDGEGKITGWASLNVFNVRESYQGVSDLSIYIRREERGKGLGKHLLVALIEIAKQGGFHKLVLSTFAFNVAGQRLYESVGFTKVGTYMKQGMLDGKWIDMTIMEKLLLDNL